MDNYKLYANLMECVLTEIIQRDLQEYISLAVPDSKKLLPAVRSSVMCCSLRF